MAVRVARCVCWWKAGGRTPEHSVVVMGLEKRGVGGGWINWWCVRVAKCVGGRDEGRAKIDTTAAVSTPEKGWVGRRVVRAGGYVCIGGGTRTELTQTDRQTQQLQ